MVGARAGEIHHFTGIDSPYEPPLHPEIHLDTAVLDVAQCVELIIDHLAARGYLSQL